MTEYSPDQIREIIKIKKIFNINSYNTFSFNDGYSKVENLTNDLPVIQREQYRLFCSFCLFKIGQQSGGSSQTKKKLPEQILNFHHRLLNDINKLTYFQVKDRWEAFGIKSPSFLKSLTVVANGDPDLERIIRFIKTPPSGKQFLDFLNENSSHVENVLELNPVYLHFLPSKLNGISNLISQEEYEQVQMSPSV
ncbi:hypothetical protein TRFO_36233 [Tritrichomonas foetus]|uniref:Uncharacterized protein n=1 Tax=Tritrichomonas foetus TaxID=1144522 RepID=A0A1J4JGZ8_9EUKA|nr:hypothetical protein TRFO_36233 [Tritrichomonas foetus]|eukprot:OHS97543.1 hypothetical protein TRFO_36233 [Tritrichomonas foetus]